MNEHKLDIQMCSASCDDTPVDQYVQSLAQAGTMNEWNFHSGPGGLLCFRFDDTKRGLVTTLVCEAQTEEYSQYCLEAKTPDGVTEMRSVEWVAAGNHCLLQTLYNTLEEAMQDAADGVSETEEIGPDDDATLTNAFIDALLEDIKGDRNQIQFIRKGGGFVADGFGISESIITLTKDWEDDTSARFFIKLEKPDGELILSCAETSKHTDEDAELRQLYRLLDETLPIVTIDTATQDVRYFIEGKAFDAFLDRVLKYAQPDIPAIEPTDVEGKVLIYDIFTSVGEASVIRQFLDEIALRKKGLPENEYKRLKALSQSVFSIIRNTHRRPNGCVFTSRAIPVAYDSPGLANRGTRWSSSLSHIANSYTTWGVDVVGQNPAIGEGRVLQKVAVLILSAILADQIA